MTRLAFILALQPVAALAEPDEFSLDCALPRGVECDEYRVDYYNSASRQSSYAPRWLNNGGMTVGLRLDIGQGPETLVITDLPQGWIALPSNRLTLDDGEMGSLYIIRDVEHLGM
jgi:hypothetical protein